MSASWPNSASSPGAGDALTVDQLIAEVLDGPMNRIVGNLGVTTYGAPGDGSLWLWSDGGLGTFRLTDVYNYQFVDYADGFTVTYRRHVHTPNERTAWVPYSPSFVPLSDAAAAALITRVPEIKSQNVARNAYVPTDAELAAFHAVATDNPYKAFVTGRCGLINPTTDELIQWASHKWGIPTDLIRAEAHLESTWSMDYLGDRTTQDDNDQYLAAPEYARVPGVGSRDVYESLGIMQLRWHPTHLAGDHQTNPHPGTDPLRWTSTAFNLDYYGATVRGYLDDPQGWRTGWGVPGDTYAPGDYWKSVGSWFLPLPWDGNTARENYIAAIQARMISRPWTVADFSNIASQIKLLRQPPLVRSGSSLVLVHPRPVDVTYVPPTVPGAPTGLTITPGDTTLSLTWTPPASDGGAPLRTYRIREVNEGWTVDTGGTNVQPFRLTGLPNGTSHTFTIAAFNDVGYGAESNQATGTPAAASVPGAPTNVTGTPGNASVILDWDAPGSNGGSAITGYRIIPRIDGVAQSPIDTGSATPGPFTVPGLVNGTAYTFVVRALNSVGPSVDSTASSAITPAAPAGLPQPPEMPILSRGLTAYGNGADLPPALAINADYGDLWNSYPVLPSLSTPARYTLDIRSILDADKSTVWCSLRNPTRSSWNRSGALGANGVGINKMRNYKLRAHASTAGTPPAAADAGWVDLATVTDNRWSDRLHTGLNLSGYGYFEVYCTEATGLAGIGGGAYAAFKLQLRDASDAGLIPDSIGFYGDSMMAEGMWYRIISGSKYDSGNGPLESLIELATGRVAPVVWMMAEGGYGAGTATNLVGGRPEYEHVIDQCADCTFLWVQFGVNDANLVNADLTTLSPAGVNSTYAQTWKARQQALINYAVSKGMRVLMPYLVASHNNAWTKPNIIVLNAIIDQLAADNPGNVFVAADLFSFFDAHPAAFYDTLHPTYTAPTGTGDALTGYEHMLDLDSDWLVDNLYTVPGATVPGAPTNVTGVAHDSGVDLDWDPPASNGGSAITGYIITPYIGGVAQTPIATGTPVSQAPINGLVNGTAYTFKVAATNSVGPGPQSTASSAITPTASGPTTVVWGDDFEDGDLTGWNSPEELASPFTAVNDTVQAHGGTHSLHLTTGAGGSGLIRHVDNSWTARDHITRFWIRPNAMGQTTLIAMARDVGGGHLWDLYLYPNGSVELFVYGGSGAVDDLVLSAGTAPVGSWSFIEIRHNEAADYCWIKVNGGSAHQSTGDLARTNPMNQLQLWLEQQNCDISFDDVEVLH